MNPEMNFNNTLKLGPLIDPCDRISDFGECIKIVGIVQDSMLVIFGILLSFIVGYMVIDSFSKNPNYDVQYRRFWVISFISVILTLYNQRIVPYFGRPYYIEHNEEYNSAVMHFPEYTHYRTAFKTPYYIGYVCFYLYDFLFLFLSSTINRIFEITGNKLAKVFKYILLVYYVAYLLIVLGCVLFSINFFSDICGPEWLTFAYNFNFVIHPSVLALFYFVATYTFIFNEKSVWLVPKPLQTLMKLMIFFIMFLTFIQTAFAIFRFHFTPNAFAVWAAFNYIKHRYPYLNIILSYDFLVFIFPLMCLVVLMLIMSKINLDDNVSPDELNMSLEKSLVISNVI